MKNIKYLILALIPALFITGCTEDLPGSKLITYPTIVLEGESRVYIQSGDSYVDPGAQAFEGDQTLTLETVVTARYNASYSGTEPGVAPDEYFVNYSATSSQGFVGTGSRTVVVAPQAGDLVTSIAGLYDGTTTRVNGESYSGIEMMIWPISGNTYGISGSIGHFYGDGRAYGDLYLASGGTITVNDIATNDFTFTGAVLTGFGLPVSIVSMTVDAANKTISYHAHSDAFANADWDVVMVQK